MSMKVVTRPLVIAMHDKVEDRTIVELWPDETIKDALGYALVVSDVINTVIKAFDCDREEFIQQVIGILLEAHPAKVSKKRIEEEPL